MSSLLNEAKKPTLVCIGAQKAGTSWLHEVLAEHPDVWVPPFKEVHFFDHKFIEECRKWTPWHIRKSIKEAKAKHPNPDDQEFLAYLERIATRPMFNGTWYRNIFAPAPPDATCLDVTPEYSTLPEEGVEFATRFLKKSKFVYIIRSPYSRALSQLKMNISRRKAPPSSMDEWLDEAKKPVILQRGDYKSYVPRWLDHAGQDRMLFLPFKRISTDPVGLLQTIEAFAQLPAHNYKRKRNRVHVTPQVALPQICKDYLTDATSDQHAFLNDHFGQEFTKLT